MNDEFEWDLEKAASNFDKHGVSFEEAASVFYDPLSVTVEDPKHSSDVILGRSIVDRYLVIAHTDRGAKIRIISARPATSAEKRSYER